MAGPDVGEVSLDFALQGIRRWFLPLVDDWGGPCGIPLRSPVVPKCNLMARTFPTLASRREVLEGPSTCIFAQRRRRSPRAAITASALDDVEGMGGGSSHWTASLTEAEKADWTAMYQKMYQEGTRLGSSHWNACLTDEEKMDWKSMISKMASEARRALTSCAILLTEEEKMDWKSMAAKLAGIEHLAQMSDAKRWEISHNMTAARIARNERRANDLEARVADLGGRIRACVASCKCISSHLSSACSGSLTPR